MSKAQTDQLIEEALEKIDKKLKVFYKPGSFDVFNLRVAIEKELHLIASKSAERERKKVLTKTHTLFESCLYGKTKVEIGTPYNFEASMVNITGFDEGIEALSQPKETP